jgi:hypothetical protein
MQRGLQVYCHRHVGNVARACSQVSRVEDMDRNSSLSLFEDGHYKTLVAKGASTIF